MNTLHEKRLRLQNRLKELGSVLIAYSGGVDSAYLAWSAVQIPDLKIKAILLDFPALDRTHLQEAIAFADRHRIPLEIVKTVEIEKPEEEINEGLHYFPYQKELFCKMEEIQSRLGFKYSAYGMNLDDLGELSSGQKTAPTHRILNPLVEAGLDKSDVRALAREADLEIGDKPTSPTSPTSPPFSSRISYGNPLSDQGDKAAKTLHRIDQGERYLLKMGFKQFRVHDHNGLARIEIAKDELNVVLSVALLQNLTTAFRLLGFHYVTLDCEGYRSRSMSSLLPDLPDLSAHPQGLS